MPMPGEIRIIVDATGQATVKRPAGQPAADAALILSQVVVQLIAQGMSESGNAPLMIPNPSQIRSLTS